MLCGMCRRDVGWMRKGETRTKAVIILENDCTGNGI